MELVHDERREARVAERRGDGVRAHVRRERPVRLEAADAAAQRAVLPQRDERRAGRRERLVRRDRAFGHAELGADRAARQREQRGSEVSVGAHRSVNAKDA